ncbi:hypothetical protein JCM10213_003625 [Rhodosporidiobolus nylandii]
MPPLPGAGPLVLPTVSFRPLDPSEPFATPPSLDNPQQFTPFGYIDGDTEWDGYRRIEEQGDDGRYIRWLQPMEQELAKQVEYDMDDQDQIWLDAVNLDRKKDGLAAISYEVFEIVMDKIEKEWFDLTRHIPKKSNAVPTEDAKCAICDDGECENSNAIVFCDGCNLAVHQDCYGVPYIPEGQWLCRKCTVCPEKPVTCVLCPNPYGAFKQTTTSQWAHLLCAIWIPDTGVSNTVYMEPVDGIETISRGRWKLVCYLCKKRVGACIQCANRSCYTAFHPTCAREYGLEMRMKTSTGAPAGELKAYCDKHGEHPAPSALLRALTQAKARGGSAAQYLKLSKKKTFKTARGYQSSSSPSNGPPVVPAAIAEKVVQYIHKVKLPGKKEVVNLISRYWSLKREARRGAPLLKRIHLEPWTASATSRQHSDADKAHKLELIRLLRNDLEKVRMLTEQVRKREKKKLEKAILLKEVIETFVWPRERRMREVLAEAKALDKQHYFLRPVDRVSVPDYYDVIKHPMDWSTMADKLDRHEYASAEDFVGDVNLVLNNARRYNKPYSPVHKAALRVLEQVSSSLDALEELDDPASTASVLANHLGEVLTPEMVSEIWEHGYDTQDPDGSKVRKEREDEERKEREEKERVAREREEEERKVREEEEERVREEERAREEEKAAAAAAKKAAKGGKKDAAGKGKGKARASPPPSPSPAPEDEDEPMNVDVEDDAESAAKATSAPSARKGGKKLQGAALAAANKKRSAAEAGLDSPAPASASAAKKKAATPAPAAGRLTRAREAEAAATPAAGKGKGKAKEEKPTAKGKAKGKAKAVEVEVSPEPDDIPSPAKGGKKKPAKEEAAPEAPAMEKERSKGQAAQLEDIKPSDHFTHFETGWVLPEGSSRRRSSALPPPAAKPAAKSKKAAGKEKATPAPVASTSKAPPAKSAAKSASSPPPRAASPAPSSASSELSSVSDEDEPAAPRRTSRNSLGGATAPEPATSAKSKAAAKKANAKGKGKEKAVEPDPEQDEGAGSDEDMQVDEKPSPAKGKKEQTGSPMKPPAGEGGLENISQWEKKFKALNPLVAITEKTELGDGYLVWARLPGYPWHPAEVVDPDEEDTPAAIRDTRPSDDKYKGEVPVYFFSGNDDERTHAWLQRSMLRDLGENEEFDQLLTNELHVRNIASKAKKQVHGKLAAAQIEKIRSAFEEAAERMETSSDEAERILQGPSADGAKSGKRGRGAAKKKVVKTPASGKAGGRKR